MLRTKELTIDGAVVRIASLSFKQAREQFEKRKAVADELAQAQAAVDKESDPDKKAEALASVKECSRKSEQLFREFVITSLNNALGDAEPKWTQERMENEMDALLCARLWQEINEFMGIKMTEGKKSPGEASATS